MKGPNLSASGESPMIGCSEQSIELSASIRNWKEGLIYMELVMYEMWAITLMSLVISLQWIRVNILEKVLACLAYNSSLRMAAVRSSKYQWISTRLLGITFHKTVFTVQSRLYWFLIIIVFYNIRKPVRLLYIVWRIDPFLGNDSVNTFPREPTCVTIGRPLLRKGYVNKSSK
jgi:hypothetical protein